MQEVFENSTVSTSPSSKLLSTLASVGLASAMFSAGLRDLAAQTISAEGSNPVPSADPALVLPLPPTSRAVVNASTYAVGLGTLPGHYTISSDVQKDEADDVVLWAKTLAGTWTGFASASANFAGGVLSAWAVSPAPALDFAFGLPPRPLDCSAWADAQIGDVIKLSPYMVSYPTIAIVSIKLYSSILLPFDAARASGAVDFSTTIVGGDSYFQYQYKFPTNNASSKEGFDHKVISDMIIFPAGTKREIEVRPIVLSAQGVLGGRAFIKALIDIELEPGTTARSPLDFLGDLPPVEIFKDGGIIKFIIPDNINTYTLEKSSELNSQSWEKMTNMPVFTDTGDGKKAFELPIDPQSKATFYRLNKKTAP